MTVTSNFEFLRPHNRLLAELGSLAEATLPIDRTGNLQQSVASYEKQLQEQQQALQQLTEQLEQERNKQAAIEAPAKPDQYKRQQHSQQVADQIACFGDGCNQW